MGGTLNYCRCINSDVPAGYICPNCGGVGAAEAPTPQDETAWLIENDGLCLGFECNQPKWVAFTNEKALRFARKIDGEHVRKYLVSQFPGSKFANDDCSVTEHRWTR